jgi:lactoylglutathione lyase
MQKLHLDEALVGAGESSCCKALADRTGTRRRARTTSKSQRIASNGFRPPEKCQENTVKLGYTIIYVPDVSASLAFFEKAFGLKRRFLHESGTYGELDTGATTLSFAAHALGDMNFPGGHVHADTSAQPLGFEIALVTDDVANAHGKAVAAGAREMAAPHDKPWGQTVSYVRCPDGILVELCTPITG